jgi:phosphate-selective porin OprO/OprP
MERALPNVFAPGYHLGVGLSGWGDRWSAAAAVTGEDIDDPAGGGEDSWGGSARFTWVPWRDGDDLLHLGASGTYRDVSELDQLRLRARPESHATSTRYVDTGDVDLPEPIWPDLDLQDLRDEPLRTLVDARVEAFRDADFTGIGHADSQTSWGLEAAMVKGPISLQGEYMQSRVRADRGDLTFDGWYVFGSWFLTGESRDYSTRSGDFGAVKPRHDLGALELGVRLSELDLTDGWVKGGEERILTFGLNWYVNRNVRLMFNYLLIDNDENADGDGRWLGDDDPRAFQMRVQAYF